MIASVWFIINESQLWLKSEFRRVTEIDSDFFFLQNSEISFSRIKWFASLLHLWNIQHVSRWISPALDTSSHLRHWHLYLLTTYLPCPKMLLSLFVALPLLLMPLTHATHTNNWALIASTSRYWFNYRHTSNALSFYHTVRNQGIPDSQILLLLPDEYACNPRNGMHIPHIYNNRQHNLNLHSSDIEVDYRGTDVSTESILRLLTGRHSSNHPRSKRLLSDENSNVLVYLTGHGGDEFLKLQDQQELSAHDISDAFSQMKAQKRYGKLLFISDTCQAATLHKHVRPNSNVVAIGSSRKGESSYSHHSDSSIGLSVIDRFTYYTLDYFEQMRISGVDSRNISLQQLFDSYTFENLLSEVEYRNELSPDFSMGIKPSLAQVSVSDFFSAVTNVYTLTSLYPFNGTERSEERSNASETDFDVENLLRLSTEKAPNQESFNERLLVNRKSTMGIGALFIVAFAGTLFEKRLKKSWFFELALFRVILWRWIFDDLDSSTFFDHLNFCSRAITAYRFSCLFTMYFTWNYYGRDWMQQNCWNLQLTLYLGIYSSKIVTLNNLIFQSVIWCKMQFW